MSHRPGKAKQLRKLRKQVQRTPLPRLFDPVEWLKSRRHAQTTGEALKIILEGRLRSGSHIVGRHTMQVLDAAGKPEDKDFVLQAVPVALRDQLIVLPPKNAA